MSKKTDANDKMVAETKEKIKKVAKPEKKERSKVISLDGEVKERTSKKDKKLKETVLTLTESIKGKKPITGIIEGIETFGDKTAAIVWVDGFKVMILAEHCVEDFDAGDREVDMYEKYLLGKRLGSEVDFIILGFDEDSQIAAASRLDAMEKKKKQFFLEKNHQGESIITEDAIVEARVVIANRAGIIVEICGVEAFVPCRELSYQRIQDAAAEFSVGEIVEVKILSITQDEEGAVSVEVSVKQAAENPCIAAIRRYNVEDKYVGKVTMVDESGVFVALPGDIDVLCKFPDRHSRPVRGTRVTVRITQKNEELCRLFGLITHVSGLID